MGTSPDRSNLWPELAARLRSRRLGEALAHAYRGALRALGRIRPEETRQHEITTARLERARDALRTFLQDQAEEIESGPYLYTLDSEENLRETLNEEGVLE